MALAPCRYPAEGVSIRPHLTKWEQRKVGDRMQMDLIAVSMQDIRRCVGRSVSEQTNSEMVVQVNEQPCECWGHVFLQCGGVN